jgi:hypothetical protein
MGFTNRISLADWQEYKKTEISLDVSPKIIRQKTDHEDPTGMIDDHYTHDDIIKIELKNGPYDSIESAKNEVLDFIRLLNTRAKSEVKHSVTFSLSPDKAHLIGNVVRYSTHNLHRPNVEAGAPEDTLEVEFNFLKWRHDLLECIGDRGQGIKPFNTKDEYNETVESRAIGYQREVDFMDMFYDSLDITDRPSSFKNSWICLRKNADIEFPSTCVHYLNQLNLTFVMQTSSQSDVARWEEHTKKMFSKEHMLINWKPNLKTHFKEWHSDDEAEDDNPLHYSWHWRSSYKLDSDIWAINISKNSVSSVSNYIMTDFINHFGEFEYDWNSFPCNLYVGSVCKILSE